MAPRHPTIIEPQPPTIKNNLQINIELKT